MKRVGILAAAVALAVPLLAVPAAAPAQGAPDSGEYPAASAGETLTVTDLASRYEGSHLRYRIPALTTAPNGDLLAVYDGRPTMADLPSNISVLLRRSTDGGRSWQEPEVVRSEPAPNGFGDPSVLVDRETDTIFVFYAASINQGFAGSATGNDPSDPNVLHPDVSISEDNGLTWRHERLTAQLKEPAWGGMFASSGEGIQLRQGPHAGRLIQQYAVRANGGNYAMSAFSDDHGRTWHHSELVGPGADENKTVELADGTVMLNSRSAPYRQVATSTDGGASYTPFAPDTQLEDPANNGSIIRAFPDAAPSDPKAQILLFSNTEDTGIRRNLTVKMSCDSGATWPVRAVVEPGSAGYSTLTALPGPGGDLGGSYGLLYEREGYNHLSYTAFDLDWLGGVCAPIEVSAPGELATGSAGLIDVDVTNQTDAVLAAGTVRIDGWSEPVPTPAIPAGESATVTVPVRVPAGIGSGAEQVTVRYETGGTSSTRVTRIEVSADLEEVVSAPGPWTLPDGDTTYIDLTGELEQVADLAAGSFSVTFATEQRPAVGVLLSASDSSSTVKDVILSLNSGKPYLEVRTGGGSYPSRITTGVDVADGEEHTLTVVADGATTRLLLDGEEIGRGGAGFFASVSDLDSLQLGAYHAADGRRWPFTGTISGVSVSAPAAPAPAIEVLPVLDATYPGGRDGVRDDLIAPWIRIANTGNVALTGIVLEGPDNSATCNRANPLGPRESYVCKSVRHTITDADVAAGQWAPTFTATARGAGTAVTTSARLTPVEIADPGAPTTGSAVWIPSGDVASSAMVRVPRAGTHHENLPEATVLRMQAAAGEHVSSQLAVSAFDGLEQVSAHVSDLSSPAGTIPAAATRVRFPSYIPDLVAGGVVADPLTEAASVDVPAGRNQGIWFTTLVPAGTAPGGYTGTVTVTSAGGELGTWPVRIDVADMALRPVDERPFTLDMWAHPDAVADHLGLEPWSAEHLSALTPYLQDLADHGQRIVDVAIVDDPWLISSGGEWVPQTQSHYRSSIEWRWDGEEWSFDYDAFDGYVDLNASVGISDAIHVFAMLQFRDREVLTYTDTRTGERTQEVVDRSGDRYRGAWGAFLTDFQSHLEARGWFERTRLAFDERPVAIMNQAFAVIDDVAPAWRDKVALAANSLAEADIADFISFNYSFLDNVPDDLIAQRVEAGEPTLFYTYYDPVRPNTVTASPPVSTRSLGWIVEQRGLDGYLRWTYNSWPADVYSDPAYRYGQGDEYIVYPGEDGPISSIRWENFRTGQEDAEVLDQAAALGGRVAAVTDGALASIDPRAEGTPEVWAAMLQAKADVLDAASSAVGVSATSEDVVGRGGPADLRVEVTAGAEDLTGLTVELDTLGGAAGAAIDVPAGETGGWDLTVDIPESARTLIVLSGRVLDADGQVVAHFTEVPLVGELVSADGEIIATKSNSLDASEPVILSVPARNRSAEPHELTLALTDGDFWRLGESAVTLPAGFDDDLLIELYPDGETGWSTVGVALLDGEVTLAAGTFDLVSGGVHVSDLDWVSSTNGWGPVERDSSVGEDEPGDGGPLTIGGRGYSKGLGVHAVSTVVIDVPETCTTFVSDYGIDDEVAGAASVTFELLGDGAQLWASELVTPASGRQRVAQDLTGVGQLTLRVGDGGNGVGQDHADWAGAHLACDVPDSGGGDSGGGTDADADGGTDGGTDADGGADAGADVDGGTDGGADVDGGADAGADVDGDADAGADVDGGADAGAEVDGDADAGAEVEGGSDANGADANGAGVDSDGGSHGVDGSAESAADGTDGTDDAGAESAAGAAAADGPGDTGGVTNSGSSVDDGAGGTDTMPETGASGTTTILVSTALLTAAGVVLTRRTRME
ncbi:glycoside hydrolase domain-containing protein [Pseudactinotalea sp. HY158]|uniref:glycoside hydrolase domain-containing protein n=1 Tax=Pseudactinotalea sp. HY158 TaxID=2654547 RepID=UPI00129C1BEE|nr:glycoside hydrolase domain-containing protein [Pseudactinotalea sp. HY158]QGH68774.1 DUF4091 domain-containing protein [Pseudactinotalea sp. HY158]